MIPSDLSPDFFRILTALTKLVVLAMLLERALVLLFDYRWFREKIGSLGFKSPIAFIVSWAVAIVAGGSAGAITLFQGVLKFSKTAQDEMKEVQKAQKDAELAEAKARKAEAEAREKRTTTT